MSFPHYERYEPSGADYLGVVPAHWGVRPLKHLATLSSGGTPSKERRDFWDGDIPWASAKDLKSELLLDTADHITEAAIDDGGAHKVADGAVLVLVRGMMLARAFPVCVAGQPMAINQDLKALISRPGMRNDYLAWLLRGTSVETLNRLDEAGHGTKALRMEAWTSMKLPMPPLIEQEAIATFLDRETAKIDALVEEQRRLIGLLKEKRQAVIAHAVTRGLDPTVPMKNSGVDWLGEVPVHWELMPLKRQLAFLTSGSRGWADHYSDEGALFLRIGNLTRDRIDLDLSDIQRVNVPSGSEGERTKVQAGDILFSITAYLGSVAVVPDGLEPAFVSQHVALARLTGQRLLPRWAALVASSHIGRTYLDMQGYGGTKIQLSLDDVAGLLMVVPPRQEQALILAEVERQLQQFDVLAMEMEAGVELLQERRAALISAAVTGKIDVRSVLPEAVAA